VWVIREWFRLPLTKTQRKTANHLAMLLSLTTLDRQAQPTEIKQKNLHHLGRKQMFSYLVLSLLTLRSPKHLLQLKLVLTLLFFTLRTQGKRNPFMLNSKCQDTPNKQRLLPPTLFRLPKLIEVKCKAKVSPQAFRCGQSIQFLWQMCLTKKSCIKFLKFSNKRFKVKVSWQLFKILHALLMFS
jgi:hypothetical protein